MRKFIFVLQLLLLQISARSQQTVCDCKANLDTLIVKTEQNYAGYPEKIKGNQENRYRSLVSSLRKAARITTTPKACYELLADYVRFFMINILLLPIRQVLLWIA